MLLSVADVRGVVSVECPAVSVVNAAVLAGRVVVSAECPAVSVDPRVVANERAVVADECFVVADSSYFGSTIRIITAPIPKLFFDNHKKDEIVFVHRTCVNCCLLTTPFWFSGIIDEHSLITFYQSPVPYVPSLLIVHK